MTAQEAHYEFKLLHDRVDTLSKEDFNPAEIDWFMNKAQLDFIKSRMSRLSNPKREGFEGSQKRIDDLSTLVVKFPEQPPIIPTLDQGVYEVPLSLLAQPYLQLIAAFADVTADTNCTKRISLRFVQHDDYRDALRDPFNSPSLEFLPYNFGRSSAQDGSSIYIYSTLPVENVYLEYVKYPRQFSLGTYPYIDGSTIPTQTFELPAHTHPEIIAIAVRLAAMAVEDPNNLQLKMLGTTLSE